MSDPRSAVRAKARRVVVKIGSSTLARDAGAYDRLASAVRALSARASRSCSCRAARSRWARRNWAIVHVRRRWRASRPPPPRARASSCARTKRPSRARSLAVAQVLLTHADLADRVRANNARAALSALLEARAVPVLNENDSVAVEEIKFGDNDELSAMVTPLVDADVLVLLSDVDGPARRARARACRSCTTSRPRHCRSCARRRATSAPAAWRARSRRRAARRSRARTWSSPMRASRTCSRASSRARTRARCSWRRRAVSRQRSIGSRSRCARTATCGSTPARRPRCASKGKSVLAIGVSGVRGDFRAGDSVRVLAPDGEELGRGLARCSSTEAVVVAGRKKKKGAPEDHVLDPPRRPRRLVMAPRRTLGRPRLGISGVPHALPPPRSMR